MFITLFSLLCLPTLERQRRQWSYFANVDFLSSVNELLLCLVPGPGPVTDSSVFSAPSPPSGPAAGAFWSTTTTTSGHFTWPTCASQMWRETPPVPFCPLSLWTFVSPHRSHRLTTERFGGGVWKGILFSSSEAWPSVSCVGPTGSGTPNQDESELDFPIFLEVTG